LVGLLDRTHDETTTRRAKHKPHLCYEKEKEALLSEPLTSDVSKFWSGGSVSDDLLGKVMIPLVPAALPKRLGNFPFWRGEERFLDAIEPIYIQASQLGINVFLGEKGYFEDSLK